MVSTGGTPHGARDQECTDLGRDLVTFRGPGVTRRLGVAVPRDRRELREACRALAVGAVARELLGLDDLDQVHGHLHRGQVRCAEGARQGATGGRGHDLVAHAEVREHARRGAGVEPVRQHVGRPGARVRRVHHMLGDGHQAVEALYRAHEVADDRAVFGDERRVGDDGDQARAADGEHRGVQVG
jgi:hypothetical protein